MIELQLLAALGALDRARGFLAARIRGHGLRPLRAGGALASAFRWAGTRNRGAA